MDGLPSSSNIGSVARLSGARCGVHKRIRENGFVDGLCWPSEVLIRPVRNSLMTFFCFLFLAAEQADAWLLEEPRKDDG